MNEVVAHSGAWVLSIIMIVVVSWIFYRYFAPKTWREWAGAGLVQAFIIALYAEMYGFPLTVCSSGSSGWTAGISTPTYGPRCSAWARPA